MVVRKIKKDKIWVVVLSLLYVGAYDAMNNSLLFLFKGVSKVSSYLMRAAGGEKGEKMQKKNDFCEKSRAIAHSYYRD